MLSRDTRVLQVVQLLEDDNKTQARTQNPELKTKPPRPLNPPPSPLQASTNAPDDDDNTYPHP